MTQPRALYLADVLANDPNSKAHHDAAAAELRRLHAQRDALLEALKFVIRGVPDTWEGVQKARAAIAKAEEKA